MQEYIYNAIHIWSVFERGQTTISAHRTEEGAIKAINEHKAKVRERWEELNAVEPYDFPYGEDQDWKYEKVKLEN